MTLSELVEKEKEEWLKTSPSEDRPIDYSFVRFNKKLGEPTGKKFIYNDLNYKKYENKEVVWLGGLVDYDGQKITIHICFKLKEQNK